MTDNTDPSSAAARYRNDNASSGGGGTLAGDVTGASSANTVVALQNKPIPSGAIGFGNVLVSNGTLWTIGAQTNPTIIIADAPAPLTVLAGSTNIVTGTAFCNVTHLRIEQNTRACISTISFSISAIATGNFLCEFAALFAPQLGTINGATVVAGNVGAGPTSLCTPLKIDCDFPSGNIRLRGITGAGITQGPFSGTVTVAYRY